jgi:hypothetical protein
MHQKTKISCALCKFSHKDPQLTQLECRRYPPKPLPTQRMNPLTQQVETGIMSVPSTVPTNFWCGEFVPKTNLLTPLMERRRASKGGQA